MLFSFADAQPTDAEREVWEQVDVVLKDAKGILDELQAYKGAGQEIREVIQMSKTHGRDAALVHRSSLRAFYLELKGSVAVSRFLFNILHHVPLVKMCAFVHVAL